MPTGMTPPGGQLIFNNAIFEEIFTNDNRIIGDALLTARLTLLANSADDYRQISDTFLLFGDPATVLKMPLPQKPNGISVSRTLEEGVLISWDEARDCHGDPVAGYHIYRRAETETGFNRLNTALINTTSFTDTDSLPGTLYYYRVASVDNDGDQGVMSIAMTPTGASGSGDSFIAGACFASSCTHSATPKIIYIALVIGALSVALARLKRFKTETL